MWITGATNVPVTLDLHRSVYPIDTRRGMPPTPDDGSRTRERESSELPTRRIHADGEQWIVREVPAPAFDRRGGTHLIFEGVEVMRRVRSFPPDWPSLSDDDLYALSLDIKRS